MHNNIINYSKYSVIGSIPYEQYMFFIIEVITCVLVWCINVKIYGLNTISQTENISIDQENIDNKLDVLKTHDIPSIATGLMEVSILLLTNDSSYYLGLICIWCIPIITYQLWYNKELVKQNATLISLSVLFSTTYFSIIDKFMIDKKMMIFNNDYLLKSNRFDIPYEEILFLFMTSTMCILYITNIMNYYLTY